jgi:hypothetical protein
MDITQIFKKAWNLVWRYRALWLFGFLLALTVNNALWLGITQRDEAVVVENRIILSDTATITFPGQGVTIDLRAPGGPVIRIEGLEPGWYRDLTADLRLSNIWTLLISIGIVLLISALLLILLRYTSLAALIRMVDENERSDQMVNVWRGLRLGWSRVAGKLFLIDLSISLLVFLVFSLLFTLAISPFFLFGLGGAVENAVSVVGIILLGLAGLLLFTLLVFAASVILSITRPVMYQACAVDGLGVWASIRLGFKLLKTRFERVIVTWLIWLAVRLAWTIAIIPALIILSPLLLLTVPIGIVIAGVPTLLAAGIASLFVAPTFAWIIGAVFGLPLFLLVMLSPIFFLSGLVEVFKSSFWTLSYREFRPLTSDAS